MVMSSKGASSRGEGLAWSSRSPTWIKVAEVESVLRLNRHRDRRHKECQFRCSRTVRRTVPGRSVVPIMATESARNKCIETGSGLSLVPH
jgi:hypothetical protein